MGTQALRGGVLGGFLAVLEEPALPSHSFPAVPQAQSRVFVTGKEENS